MTCPVCGKHAHGRETLFGTRVYLHMNGACYWTPKKT